MYQSIKLIKEKLRERVLDRKERGGRVATIDDDNSPLTGTIVTA